MSKKLPQGLIIIAVGLVMLWVGSKINTCNGVFCFITGLLSGNFMNWAVGNILTMIGMIVLAVGLWKLIRGKR